MKNSAAPGMLRHLCKIERMTRTSDAEESPDWGRGWLRTPELERTYSGKSLQWTPTAGRSSEELRALGRQAKSRVERKHLEKQAALAEREESEHQASDTKLARTLAYCDRNRFRCLGAPLQVRGVRESLRSTSMASSRLEQRELGLMPTPIIECFHPREFRVRSETVLRTHIPTRQVRTHGFRRGITKDQTILSNPDLAPAQGRVDVVGYGSGTKVIQLAEPPMEEEMPLVSDTLMATAKRVPFNLPPKRRRPATSQSGSVRSDDTMRPSTSWAPSPKRIFVGVRCGSIFDPAASLRPPSRSDSLGLSRSIRPRSSLQ